MPFADNCLESDTQQTLTLHVFVCMWLAVYVQWQPGHNFASLAICEYFTPVAAREPVYVCKCLITRLIKAADVRGTQSTARHSCVCLCVCDLKQHSRHLCAQSKSIPQINRSNFSYVCMYICIHVCMCVFIASCLELVYLFFLLNFVFLCSFSCCYFNPAYAS